MPDERTSEPTEAQVESLALWHSNSTRSIQGLPPVGAVEELASPDYSRDQVRAALVAAQGAAPQAEGVPKSTYISPNLPGMIRNLWKSDPSENSVRTALKLAGDLIQELIDLKASPVLPSSTVDEDALAEVIGKARTTSVRDNDGVKSVVMESNEQIARAVIASRAEWFKEQGR